MSVNPLVFVVRGKASRRIRKKYEQDRLGGSCYRGRTQFETNCLGCRKLIFFFSTYMYLQRRLQDSPERTYHTPTITSKLLLRLGAPRGARSSWMVFSKRRRSKFAITTPRLNNHWKYLKIHGYTMGLKRLEEVCEKKTFWRTNSKHSRQVSTGPKPLFKEIQRVVRNSTTVP